MNLWCRYTSEEVYILKQALRGALMLGISEGTGQERESYLQTFNSEAIRITGNDVYAHHRHFIQTVYIHDSLVVVADALDELIKEKAHMLNTSEDSIEITKADRELLAKKLQNLNSSDGLSGNIVFTDDGERTMSQIDLRNFVPIENTNFSVDSSPFEDPWIVQTRACLEVFPDGSVSITYFDEDRNVSKVSTVIFHDGTTNPPLDRYHRIAVRSKKITTTQCLTLTVAFSTIMGKCF